VLVLVPTRELALQTSQVTKELGKHLKVEVMVTTGGTSLKDVKKVHNKSRPWAMMLDVSRPRTWRV